MPEVMYQGRVPAWPGYLTYRFGGSDNFRRNVDTYVQHYVTPCVGRNQSFDLNWLVRAQLSYEWKRPAPVTILLPANKPLQLIWTALLAAGPQRTRINQLLDRACGNWTARYTLEELAHCACVTYISVVLIICWNVVGLKTKFLTVPRTGKYDSNCFSGLAALMGVVTRAFYSMWWIWAL